MKRTLLSTAAALLCLPLLCQEAEDSGNHAQLLIVPRLEYNPYFAGGESPEHTLGASALYTFLDGDITENLSFSICNHWLSGEPAALYQNTLRSDSTNWLDWANLTYSFNGFAITVGKQAAKIAAFEYDPCDVESDFAFGTSLYNNLPGYQWGGDFSYTLKDGCNTFGAQILTSPYGEKPFASGRYMFTGYWRGEFDIYSATCEYTTIQQTEKGGYDRFLSIGQMLSLDALTLELDYVTPFTDYCIFAPKHALRGMVTYTPSESVEVALKGCWESSGSALYDFDESGLCGSKIGGGVRLHPLKNKKLMTIQLLGGYLFQAQAATVIAGVTFNIPVQIY